MSSIFLINTRVGDSVRYGNGFGTDSSSYRPRFGSVESIRRRYGCVNHGQARQQPLVTIFNHQTRTRDKVCLSLIEEIIVPAPVGLIRAPINIYGRGEASYSPRIPGTGYAEDSLLELVEYYLGGLNMTLDRELDEDAIYALLEDSSFRLPGLAHRYGKSKYCTIRVRIKPFAKWVRQNAYRFMRTVKDLDDTATRANMANEENTLDALIGDMERMDEEWRLDDEELIQGRDTGLDPDFHDIEGFLATARQITGTDNPQIDWGAFRLPVDQLPGPERSYVPVSDRFWDQVTEPTG